MNASRSRPTAGMFQDVNNSTSGENTENESTAPKKSMEWSADNEEILVEWGDTAQCYKWLHTECHRTFSVKHAWYTIPAIIFSTIAGTASFAQSSLSRDAQFYASLAIGTVNIFVGILSTVQEYLKISEKRESHRVAFVSWDKYARNIRVELAKTPMERADAHHFIKVCRSEYDRLMETSPSIREDTIAKFFKTFSGSVDSERRAHFDILKKPDICNSIVSMNETRRKWFDDQQTRPVAYTSAAASSIRNGAASQKSLELWRTPKDIPFKTLFAPQPQNGTTEFYDTRPIAIFERDKINIQKNTNIANDAFFKDTGIDLECGIVSSEVDAAGNKRLAEDTIPPPNS
jgi:hypothetical protein